MQKAATCKLHSFTLIYDPACFRKTSQHKQTGVDLKTLTLKAPAKVNYLLDVIRKRPDGYHELRMIMQRVNLCDEITINLIKTPELSVTCGKKGVPDGPGNIAWKAARTMLDLAGTGQGAKISVVKNIPVAAGLGGGSSDAATVLMGMNEILGLDLSEQQLMEIGLKLGADVPFFIFKKTALAEGVGEKLQTMPEMPKLWVLLVNPCVHVSTAWVYQNLTLTDRPELAKLPEFFGTIQDVCSIMSNDLETVTIPSFPVIKEIKNRLLEMGAAGAMMSGSGPTVFGLFNDQQSAETARDSLAKNEKWFTAAIETL